MIDWIDFGQVSAERDDKLSKYFFDSGVLNDVTENKLSFLVLGRKGAGKTAVFTRFDEDYHKYLSMNDASMALSLQNYDWNIHELLSQEGKAKALAYTESWKFIILVETLYVIEFLKLDSKHTKPLSKLIRAVYGTSAPTLKRILGDKLLGLSRFKLPGGSLNLDEGELDEMSASLGNVEFSDFSTSSLLRETLTENISRIVPFLERGLKKHFAEADGRVFVSFDRLDEAWLVDSRNSVRPMLSGLVAAAESITQNFGGKLRPVVFLREDIFSDLDLNDKNKLRTDCGNVLGWNHDSLNRLILHRVNYHAQTSGRDTVNHVNELFDRVEMRQRRKPFDYLLLRTMMRPRDLIHFLSLVKSDMVARDENPFEEEEVNSDRLECQAIYNAEVDYSLWLLEELTDEWVVQYPALPRLFDAIREIGTTTFKVEELELALRNLGLPAGKVDLSNHLRFLYSNSIIGFKVGKSNQWRFRCFNPTTGFSEVEIYKVHDGLIHALNLKEQRA
ncbi:P-loop ATPase, Sll1717 family [Pseudooctadecabacter jejudonensis]|uniref:ATPase n=1 Tax=Pseudooctadecabacter jejudonensis TaxID=1391910 RepID=A0A1Y5SN52_9RHOB|nr:hypothetical protein [Pseudooctadecabacter jejudonensis]SLN42860.1 hypothetical protein PSJ8397_02180 [Pseudooctadecabacter jejudonensis]